MSNQRPPILFSPPTPRPSPTLLPQIFTNSAVRSRVHKEHSITTTTTTDDHGSFVSVSANEDPLSLSSSSSNPSMVVPMTFECNNDVKVAPFPDPSSTVPTSSQPSHLPTRTDNASLTFFDKFAQNAKRNSDIRRKGLMDELLKCDDDPLYFLHNGLESTLKKDEEHSEDRGESFDSDKKKLISDAALRSSPPPPPPPLLPPPADTVLHDVDHEYFSSSRRLVSVDTNTHTDNDKTPSERLFTSFHTRSPSQPSPPTLAPPIMDSNISDLHTLFDDLPTKDDIRPSSSSSSSASAFSARWMSNLLKTSTSTGLQQHGQAVASTLESILGVGADAPPSSSHPSSGTPPPTAASTVSAIHRRSSSTLPMTPNLSASGFIFSNGQSQQQQQKSRPKTYSDPIPISFLGHPDWKVEMGEVEEEGMITRDIKMQTFSFGSTHWIDDLGEQVFNCFHLLIR